MAIQVSNDSDPIAPEVLAREIESIAKAMKTLDNTRLTRAAVVALIHDRSKVAKSTINVVLNNLTELEKDWLKPNRKHEHHQK